MEAFGFAAAALLGLVLGSFATALSYRLPRDLSIITKMRSQCPSCGKDLACRDLVPVFSWFFLKGKCRFCRAAIGWQYPVIELSTAVLCLIFYSVYGFSIETFPVFVLAPVIISLIYIDLYYKIIPDGLNLTVLLTGVAALAINAAVAASPADFLVEKSAAALGGAAIYGIGSWLLRQGAMMVLKREAMGLGDVKFFAAAGFWLGLSPDAAALFLAVSGIVGIIIATAWKKKTGDAEAPFGPSLMAAFIAVLTFYPPDFMYI